MDGTTGTYDLVFTASNGVAPDAVQNFTLLVNAAAVPSGVPVLSFPLLIVFGLLLGAAGLLLLRRV